MDVEESGTETYWFERCACLSMENHFENQGKKGSEMARTLLHLCFTFLFDDEEEHGFFETKTNVQVLFVRTTTRTILSSSWTIRSTYLSMDPVSFPRKTIRNQELLGAVSCRSNRMLPNMFWSSYQTNPKRRPVDNDSFRIRC